MLPIVRMCWIVLQYLIQQKSQSVSETLSFVASLHLLCVSVSSELRVTVVSDYTPAPGEAPGELGDNEFTAGSLLTLKCLVTGNSSEGLSYTWSVSGNPGCCNIDTSSTANTLNVGRPLYSYYAGDYTCRVEEAGRTGSSNSDVFSVSVVGEFMSRFISQ